MTVPVWSSVTLCVYERWPLYSMVAGMPAIGESCVVKCLISMSMIGNERKWYVHWKECTVVNQYLVMGKGSLEVSSVDDAKLRREIYVDLLNWMSVVRKKDGSMLNSLEEGMGKTHWEDWGSLKNSLEDKGNVS